MSPSERAAGERELLVRYVPAAVARTQALDRDTWLAALRAAAAGDIPPGPSLAYTGARMVAAEAGRIGLVAACPAAFVNLGGTAHGGWFSAVLDLAAGQAALSVLERELMPPTVRASIEFLEGTDPDVEVDVVGEVVRHSRRLVVADALATVAGRLLARGSFLFAPVPTDRARGLATTLRS